MQEQELRVPEIVWETLQAARVRLLVEEGYEDSFANYFADTEFAWRKQMSKQMSAHEALLADLVWVHGMGDKVYWCLELKTPPEPEDVALVGKP